MNHTSNLSKTLDYVRSLKAGDHVIFFYRNPYEKHEVLFEFLQTGFEKGERGIYVATQETSKQLCDHMEDFGLNVKALERNGMLRIYDYDGWYLLNGDVNVAHTKMMWKRVCDEAMESGLEGLRGCGELACFFEHKKEKELMEYELGMGRRLDLPMTALCAYDMSHVKSLEEGPFFSLISAHGPVVTSSFTREVNFKDFFATIANEVLERVFGEKGKETLLRMLCEDQLFTPDKIGEDPRSFTEGLEELIGSGAQVVTRSILEQMYAKMGIT